MNATTTAALRAQHSPTTALAAKPKTMSEIVKLDRKRQFPAMLEAFKGQIQMALPEHLTAERMARLAMTAFNNNPQLALCEPNSVFASVILASQLGLEIGVDGEAFLIPYNDRNRGKIAQFIPGWKGLVKLVNQAKMATVWTGAVFEGDKFDFALGDSPHITHQPTGKSDEIKKNLLYTYAVGRIHDAQWPVIEVWPVGKINRHLARYNKVGDRHYALKDDTNFIAYGRKVALLQVIKYMPKSVKLIAATAIESGGMSAVDLKDVIEGDWTNIAADAAAAEDHDADPADNNENQAAGEASPIDSGAAGAGTNPGPREPSPPGDTGNGAATPASESPTTSRRQRRVIE